jgi:dihydroxyacetone kinase-like protein
MKKMINAPVDVVDEMLEGLLLAHPDYLAKADGNLRCLVRAKEKGSGKVGIATGGGSGHLPLFLGYIGEGMLDGCSVGGVFQSPNPDEMLSVTEAIDHGAGVLYIFGNYGGDVMNFSLAAELAEAQDIKVEQVVAGDDVASAPKGSEANRRGVAGIIYVYKIAGACAEAGGSLVEVKAIAERACANMRSMGVGLSPCIVPEIGKPSFEIGESEMDLGMGIHGEPGIHRGPMQSADEITDTIMGHIAGDLELTKSDEVSVLINGLGATPADELYIVCRRAHQNLAKLGVSIFNTYVGEFATSMEMAGASISILRLDDELKGYLAAPASTPFFQQAALDRR